MSIKNVCKILQTFFHAKFKSFFKPAIKTINKKQGGILQKATNSIKETFKRIIRAINERGEDKHKRDKKGTIKNIWFSDTDGWFWCSGFLDDEATSLVEQGYNVSCQYRITEYIENNEQKLHNGNPYDKEILNGVFEHLAIVENPRYEDAYIAVNAILAADEDKWITIRTKEIKKAQNGWLTLDKTDD